MFAVQQSLRDEATEPGPREGQLCLGSATHPRPSGGQSRGGGGRERRPVSNRIEYIISEMNSL